MRNSSKRAGRSRARSSAVSAEKENLEALLNCLDPDRDEAGRKYVELRQKLVHIYGWRGYEFPEELADEVMDRVAAKLGQGLEIQASDPFRFICGVAHLVFKELLRDQRRRLKVLDHEAQKESERQRREIEVGKWRTPGDGSWHEARLDCLSRCLRDRPANERQLIVRYHLGEKRARIENRKQLAAELGLQGKKLRVKASRIRAKLESCTRKCLKKV